jgi:hypothetical protein
MNKLAAAVIVLAGCPSSKPDTNPAVLWLAPTDGEQDVKLVGSEPPPF